MRGPGPSARRPGPTGAAEHAAETGQTGLVGRETESAELLGLLDALADGAGGAVAVVADAGAGKSVLLDMCARAAGSRGVRVLRASGVEFEAAIGFSLLQQLLLPLLADLTPLPVEDRSVLRVAFGFEGGCPPPPDRVREAVVPLLRRTAAGAPVLLVVDDVHLADRDSAQVLKALPRALRDSRVALVAAARHDDGGQGGVLEHFSVLAVAPLRSAEAVRVLDGAWPGLAPAVLTRLLAVADGNPLALLELPALLSDGQRLGTEPLPDPLPLNRRLRRTYASRIASLPPPSRRLLLLLALEPRAPLTALHPLFADGTLLGEAVSAVVDSDLAGFAGPVLRLRHPLVGTAVVADASAEERATAHHLLSTLPAGGHGDDERRARHLAEATRKPDEGVAVELERLSAVVLHRGDASAAMAFLVRAAELSTGEEERVRRLARAAYVATSVDLGAAEKILDSVRASDPSFGASLTNALAAASVLTEGEGDVDLSHRVLTRAVNGHAHRTDPDDPVLLEAIGTLRRVCRLGGRPELWRDYRAALQRLEPGPPPLLDLAGRTASDPTRTDDDVLRRMQEAVTALGSVQDPAQVVEVAETTYGYDRVRDCRPALERVVEAAGHGGPVLLGVRALLMIGLDAFHRGRWSLTCDSALEARALGGAARYNVQGWAVDYELALLAAGRGRYAEASKLADGIARWATARRVRTPVAHVGHVESLAASGRGDFELAFQHAHSVSPAGEFSSHLALTVCLDLVEAAVRTGRRDAARAHVAAAVALAMEKFSPRMAMVSLAVRALVAEPDEAELLFERALAVPDAADWRFDHARVQLLLGSHLRRHQAVAASREPLRQAQAAFERLGALPWAERARGELAATAENRGTNTGASGVRSLTPQEREIAELAATGATNKKIAERLGISHRTVGNHLYQAFIKLDITSRGGLRDALSGPDDD